MEVLQRGKTRPDSYSGEEKRLDEGMWFMGSSRILEKSRLHLFFFFFFLIPEIEKESNWTSEVIFGIGKKDVVVGLEEMGICTSLGMEPVEQ